MAWMQNQTYVKKSNTMLVLELISHGQGMSRTQIAEMTELSPASITRMVSDLMALQLVREEGRAENAGRGRKARILCTCEDGLYTASFCVQPRKLKLCLHDFHQQIVVVAESPLLPKDIATPEALSRVAGRLLEGLSRDAVTDWTRVRVAGVSIPGLVDNESGQVQISDQLGWRNADLRGPLEKALGLPVWIENDVKACLTGERSRRMIPRQEETAYLLVGTGVGVAATSGGKVIRGCSNCAGEVEHLNLMPNGVFKDTLSEHLVEANILQTLRGASVVAESMDDLMAAYRQKLGYARLQVEDFLQYMRLVLSMIDCFYDPQQIILGGSAIQSLLPVLSDLLANPHLSVGEDYETASLLGASIGAEGYALDRLLEK